MEISEIVIRSATSEDANSMAEFASQRFKDTFGYIYDKDDLSEFIATNYNSHTFAKYISDSQMQNLLALNKAGEIIGYSQIGPMKLPLEGYIPNSLELYRFYVSDEAKGSGLAKKLFDNLMEFVRANKAPALYLGVWSENHRALAFYHKLGFEIVGKYLYQVGKTFDDERIMRLMIAE